MGGAGQDRRGSGSVRPRRLSVIVEADGGARGNPGPAGYGAVVREAGTGEVLVEIGEGGWRESCAALRIEGFQIDVGARGV